jgi:hypothetical protein
MASVDFAAGYGYVNVAVGINFGPQAGYEYGYVNVDNAAALVPHIWYLRAGRTSYGNVALTVIGNGFGDIVTGGPDTASWWYDWGPDRDAPDAEIKATGGINVSGKPEALTEARIIAGPFGEVSGLPNINVQYQFIHVNFGNYVIPAFEEGAQENTVWAILDGIKGNVIPHTLWPVMDVLLESNGGAWAGGAGYLNLIPPDPTYTDLIEQRFAYFGVDPYLIYDGKITAAPTMHVSAVTSTTSEAGTALAAPETPLSIDIKAQYRWIAGSGLTPRPDIGTGVTLWGPAVTAPGVGAMSWRMDAGTSPYLDPTYQHENRDGLVSHPAMIFPGGNTDTTQAWMQSASKMSTGEGFTIGMVAVLHQGWLDGVNYLLESFVLGAPTPNWKPPVSLVLNSGRLELALSTGTSTRAAVTLSDWTSTWTSRAAMVVYSGNATVGRWCVLDQNPALKEFTHAAHPLSTQSFWIGRPAALGAGTQNATMDVLEMFTYDRLLSVKELSDLSKKIDSVYRITGPLYNPEQSYPWQPGGQR